MKQLLTALIFILFIGVNFAQTKAITTGTYWADSLYQDYPAVTDSTDSLAVLRLNFLYDWMNITVVDTGTTYDDSCMVEYGVYALTGQIVTDTIWQPVQFMRDSSWTNINGGRFLVDDASTHSYKINIGDYDIIRVRMLNAEIVAGRVWWFYATLSKKNTRF